MNILICDRWFKPSLRKLENLPTQVRFSKTPHPTADELSTTHILLTRSRTKIDQKTLSRAPELKLIITATSGFDHIDLLACQEKGISVSYTPEANGPCASELTLFLMLSLLKKYPQHQKALQTNHWKNATPPGEEISSKTIGIIGLGRIGSRVARLTQAFGAQKVIAHDPYISKNRFEKLNVEPTNLTDLLRLADIISLHVPLTQETHHLINKKTLAHTNPEAYLINASRGKVICENSLMLALNEPRLKGVALDVFESEPLSSDSALRKYSNVFITPHIGGYTEEAFQRASREAISKVIQFIEGKNISDILLPTH